jgi:hypothetical protein
MTPDAVIGSGFTALERAVLNEICDMHPADQAALRAQLLTATLRTRENTGAGFYTRFVVERRSSAALAGERSRVGPETKIDGLQHGMGFILWLKEGYADCLEGYSYGESTGGIALEAINFEIVRP